MFLNQKCSQMISLTCTSVTITKEVLPTKTLMDTVNQNTISIGITYNWINMTSYDRLAGKSVSIKSLKNRSNYEVDLFFFSSLIITLATSHWHRNPFSMGLNKHVAYLSQLSKTLQPMTILTQVFPSPS